MPAAGELPISCLTKKGKSIIIKKIEETITA